jgi:DNA-binding transcriptional LysR family regulator
MAVNDPLAELRMADVYTFLAVRRAGSVSAAARELRVTPSQVSKSMARLENHLGVNLLVRGSHRVVLSDAAVRLLPDMEDLVERLRRIQRGEAPVRYITIAAPSYLANFAVPRIVKPRSTLMLRSLELPPQLVRFHATDNIFDVALCLGSHSFPSSWVVTDVGEVRKGLFARPTVAAALGRMPVAPERLLQYPFLMPIYSVGGQFVPADDGCPIPSAERRSGHQTATMSVGLEIAAQSDQLVFGPALAARNHIQLKQLVEVHVRGWDVRETLYVACNRDRVLQDELRVIVSAIRAAIAEPLPPARSSSPGARTPAAARV